MPRLFSPILRRVEGLATSDLSPKRADQTWAKGFDHPSIGVFVRNREGRLEAELACRFEAMAPVVFRMAEDEDEIGARFFELP